MKRPESLFDPAQRKWPFEVSKLETFGLPAFKYGFHNVRCEQDQNVPENVLH